MTAATEEGNTKLYRHPPDAMLALRPVCP